MRNYILTAIVTIITTLFVACADEDTFSSSSAYKLTFSADTVSMDTVFSKVPTSTKTFWVYNHSGSGLRCANIRLAQGNQNGFRVNVDGTYIGSEAGYQVNDIEIRKNDSIRVFVELTSPPNHQNTPQLLEDELLFTLESGIQQKVLLRAYSWDATTVRNLEIKNDTTISSSTPIIVYGGIKVDSTATLTIEGGTTLYFHDQAGIDVYGTLRCIGNIDNQVTLRGDRTDRMFDYLPYDHVSGQWEGVRFFNSSFNNKIVYTDLHSAIDGIVCDSSNVEQNKLTIQNSIVHNCKGYGLYAKKCDISVENSQITNTLKDCVAIYGGNALFTYCTIAQFYPFDSDRGAAFHFTNAEGDIILPLNSLKVINSIITGYADDVVLGEKSDKEDIPFEYNFDHCLLRTPKIDTQDSTRFSNVVWEDIKDKKTGGEKNFKLIDIDKIRYNFHLDSLSKAIGIARALSSVTIDLEGNERNEKPDAGCYSYIKNK